MLGALGNSGNSDAPHLHFHVMSTPDPLRSNGLPFVFTDFRLDSRSTGDLDALLEGKPAELEAALRKKDRKGCDLVVLNSLADKGAGFGHTTNRVRFVHGPDRIDSFELKSKDAVAVDLAEVIQARLLQRPPIAPDTTH